MSRRTKWVLGIVVVAVVAAGPVAYSAYQSKHYRNFGVVTPGVLYRSGQLTDRGLNKLIDEYGIKTVVTLRASRDSRPDPDAWEEDVCARRSMRHVRLKPKVWTADEKGEVPVAENLNAFVDVMRNPANHPVLVHCMAGIHRTGQVCAVYRMEFDGWSAEQAMAEMRAYGYTMIDDHPQVTSYLRAYQPGRTRTAAAHP